MVKIKETILENYPDDVLLFADGFDDAIIGVATDFTEPRIIYSVSKCLNTLINKDGMTYDEAVEYFTFNVSGGWIGEQTPIWCWDDFLD